MFQGVQCIGFIPQDAGKNFSDDWHDSSDCRSRPGCLIKAKFPAQMWWWFTSAVCLCGCATWPHHLPFFATHWRHLLLHCSGFTLAAGPLSASPSGFFCVLMEECILILRRSAFDSYKGFSIVFLTWCQALSIRYFAWRDYSGGAGKGRRAK